MKALPRLVAPLLVALALCPAALAESEPMTEEDVVRMFATGRPEAEILREIAAREPGFHLDPEMVEELRNVELPEAVIEAMLARQREREEEVRAEPESAPPSLQLRLNPARGEQPVTVSIGASVDPQLAAELELGNAPEDRVFADLAFFVVCHTADHVPDQWRLRSPLGRDFGFPLRHRVVAFLAGARGEAEEEGGRRVKLRLPTVLEVPLDPGVAHDLTLGLALQVGGRYRVIRSDSREGIVPGEGELSLPVRVTGRSFRSFKVRFLGDDDEAEDEDGDDGDRD